MGGGGGGGKKRTHTQFDLRQTCNVQGIDNEFLTGIVVPFATHFEAVCYTRLKSSAWYVRIYR